jgi:hypothetical protein
MFILLIDVDDDTRSVVFNDLSLHDNGDPKWLYLKVNGESILQPIYQQKWCVTLKVVWLAHNAAVNLTVATLASSP